MNILNSGYCTNNLRCVRITRPSREELGRTRNRAESSLAPFERFEVEDYREDAERFHVHNTNPEETHEKRS